MSKKIRLTTTEIDALIKKIRNKLEKEKSTDGEINISEKTESVDERATVYFKPVAWTKMCQLIHGFDTEVGWHGIAKKLNGKHEYLIEDILIYPQEVSGVTVEMDEDDYDPWLVSLTENEFNNLRMQGHSHVNMGVSPSGTDLDGNKKILSTLGDDMFYIFMIWNKKLERNIKIYDLEDNIFFENKDIDVEFTEYDSELFLENAAEMVSKKTYAVTTTNKNANGKKETKPNRYEPSWYHDNIEIPIYEYSNNNRIIEEEEDVDEDGMFYDSDWDMFFERKYTYR